LRDNYFYIVDIKYKQREDFNLNSYIKESSSILSLNPYSTYLLDLNGYKYLLYSNIISTIDFKKIVLDEYQNIEKLFNNYKEYLFFFRDFAIVKTFEVYIKELFSFFDKKIAEDYKLIYITDINDASKEFNTSYIYNKYRDFYKIVKIKNKDRFFYRKNLLKSIFYRQNIFLKIFNKLSGIQLNYDNIYYRDIYKTKFQIKNKVDISNIDNFTKDIQYLFTDKSFLEEIHKIVNDFKKTILNTPTPYKNKIKLQPFTFLSNNMDYFRILLYQKNNIPKIFMQHGSYLQENIFLKYNEIYPADINFVFNDYTKELFKRRGAKEVYSVGSINFNKIIRERNMKYDYLYILYCTSYAYSGMQIFSKLNVVDENSIYLRHKEVIELFGNKFIDKKMVIKVQSAMALKNMLYIPLLELSKNYNNITVEFFKPIHELIEESKYIISDYISSEFINSSILYKRNVLLFNNIQTALPENILEDMNKIFILIESIKDLENKIKNIEYLVKHKKRSIKLIEYYFLKECNTKKIVSSIIKKISYRIE
jgi:hypothetical protein